jgi:hypothetical protein
MEMFKPGKKKKRYLKYIFGLFLVLVIIALVFAGWLWQASEKKYETANRNLKIEYTPARTKEGLRLLMTGCYQCHYNSQTNSLSGTIITGMKSINDFQTGNITRDSATGIGSWTDGQLYYFFKTGIKPNGNFVFEMPKYPIMAEEDIYSLISFLRSDDTICRPVQTKARTKDKVGLFAKFWFRYGQTPPKLPEQPIALPDTSDMVAFGRYLATARYPCFVCHTKVGITIDYENPETDPYFFRGGNHIPSDIDGEIVISPSLIPEKDSLLENWSTGQFIKTVKTGIKPNGEMVKNPMFAFYTLSDREAVAIFEYLKTLRKSK